MFSVEFRCCLNKHLLKVVFLLKIDSNNIICFGLLYSLLTLLLLSRLFRVRELDWSGT